MNDFPWLTVLWAVPFVGAIVTAFGLPIWPSRLQSSKPSPSSLFCTMNHHASVLGGGAFGSKSASDNSRR